MEKKLYAPKATKFIQAGGGLRQKISDLTMKCHFCEKELNDSQKYEVLRGKAKGFCSKKCSQLMYAYKSKENYINSTKRTCIVCNTDFYFPPHRKQTICSPKCAGKISSERMKLKNPMSNEDTRIKVSETLKKIKHNY